MEAILHEVARHVALAIEAVAILVVALGTIRAVATMAPAALGRPSDRFEQRRVWLRYARWLVAGLTFQLAADIASTAVAPQWDEVGRLAAVAAIRTFLSYFLDREMEVAERLAPPLAETAPAAVAKSAGAGLDGNRTWTRQSTTT
jgi:uncharacterized membrane protein